MSDHERLVSVAQRWERLHDEQRAEVERWHELFKGLLEVNNELHDKLERLRALVSWIDGRLVDEAPHAEIRAGIDRWREGQK